MANRREIMRVDPTLFKAAVEGVIDAFNDHRSHLPLLLTPSKNTILHIHITTQQREMKSSEFVKKILDMCPSLLWQANSKGEIPLHIASRYGLSNIVKVLIERAKVSQEEELERDETVEILIDPTDDTHEEELERGKNKHMLRMITKVKDTALHEAVRFNHLDVVKLLIKEDRHFSYSANDVGETPLYLAAERRFRELVSEILRTSCTSPAHGGPNGLTALHAAVIQEDEEITKNIVDVKGPDITKEADQQGWTPLHHAAYRKSKQMVEVLLGYDTCAAYFADKDDERTALHIAADRGCSVIVEMLISRCPGCWELVDKRGWNVLHFAVTSYSDEAREVILRNSSLCNLINDKDNDGNTPLHQLVASSWRHKSIQQYIQHRKVDKMAFNKKNLSALDICLTNDELSFKIPIVKKLKESGARENQRTIKIKDDAVLKKIGDSKLESSRKQNREEFMAYVKEAKESHLIVATLIATVTFAAGFTLPGGYINSDKVGPELQGTAILTRKAAFIAFVISDVIAMVFSTSSVFIHLFMALIRQNDKSGLDTFRRFFVWAFFLTISAMGAMMVAFMTGLYAVLEHSLGLAIAVCVITSCFFLSTCLTLKLAWSIL